MDALEAAIIALRNAQNSIRVRRVELDVRLDPRSKICGNAEVYFSTSQPEAGFLLDSRLDVTSLVLDRARVGRTRSGPLVRFPVSPGSHRLSVRWNGSLPSNGGLGRSGSSFDLNLNLLWYPTLIWGSRYDVGLRLSLPEGTRAVLPPLAHYRNGRASMRSVIDVPLVGGKVKGTGTAHGLAAYSLVRNDVSALCRNVERVLEWLEDQWGARPFRPVRVVETWRRERGAYAREGLIVTPDWSREPEGEVLQRLVHEATHQWWGMDVLPGEAWFSEDWLSEGLATYCEYLWLNDQVGAAAAEGFRVAAAKMIRDLHGSLASCSPWSQEGWALSRYGALLALVSLERTVSDLRRVLRDFRNRHRGSFVTTRALAQELSQFVPRSWLEEHLVSDRAWPGDLAGPPS